MIDFNSFMPHALLGVCAGGTVWAFGKPATYFDGPVSILVRTLLLAGLFPTISWVMPGPRGFEGVVTLFIRLAMLAVAFPTVSQLVHRAIQSNSSLGFGLVGFGVKQMVLVVALSCSTYIFWETEFAIPFVLVAIFWCGKAAARAKRSQLAFGIALPVSIVLLELSTILVAPNTVKLLSNFGFSDLFARSTNLLSGARLGSAIGLLAIPLWAEGTLPIKRMAQQTAWRLSTWWFRISASANAIRLKPLFPLWKLEDRLVFLNHGSFGALPNMLASRQAEIQSQSRVQPMEFLARQIESRWMLARQELADWVGSDANNLAFCENATAGMNEIAAWFPLAPGDEVLLNDHEYGAVRRVWQRRCTQAQARLQTATLPSRLGNPADITDVLLAASSSRTRIVIVSHITSPTAIRLPVEQICEEFGRRNIAVCIDGPHALLQEKVQIEPLRCDFYTASCHKWLCAPLGSGFLYVAPQWHSQVRAARLSWGRVQPAIPKNWTDELLWTGTRDYSAYLTVPDAIRFFEAFDRNVLDQRGHQLACYARRKLLEIDGIQPVTPEGREWFGWMVAVWLPDGDHSQLQPYLLKNYNIEVPVFRLGARYVLRVSCHLYNQSHEIDLLCRALRQIWRR